ncbi:MAG: PAS domain S-box protein [Desulfomonilia bacterium]
MDDRPSYEELEKRLKDLEQEYLLTKETARESEERYRTIFESTATANMIVTEDTTILLVNSNFEKLTGYSKQEVENKMSWTHFVMKEELEMMKQYHRMRRVDPGSAPNAYEFKVRIRSGEIRDIFMSVAIIPGTRDSVASIIDMTERKQAEESLKRSEERFRDIANLLPETVFETDENGILTFVNQSSLKQFGFTQAEVDKGLNVMDVFAPEDRDRLIMNYQRVMQGERLGLNEYMAQRKDGSTFPTLVHSTVINRDSKPAGLRGFFIDITDQKNLEQQLMRAQKMEAVGTLAGGIAHDFNNLLMGILGNVSLMLMHSDESHPFFDRLKSVEEYVQRGSDLSKQLLGFARGGKYEVKPTHLGEFIRKSSELFGRTKKEIRIHHKVAEGLWSVEVDRGQMEQVLLNLFVNAWQAMPGGGDLYLSVENIDLDEVVVSPYDINPGRFVKVTVTDTGIGMDESVKSRIFEPFFTTKERGRGTGLGLASAYGIIKNHGGFIHVDSEKDFGTSFMIYLPASEKQVQDDLGTKDEIMKGQEAVLLIDDEEMILDVGSRMLESLGYKVMPAPGGRQGLLIYEQNMDKIDLVVLDIIMPDFGGKETFDTLRRINPAVRVLLSSGYSLDGQAKEIMQSGCKGFIQKPFSMAELSKKIREILDSDQ